MRLVCWARDYLVAVCSGACATGVMLHTWQVLALICMTGYPLCLIYDLPRILFCAKSATRTIEMLDGIANANYDVILWSKIS